MSAMLTIVLKPIKCFKRAGALRHLIYMKTGHTYSCFLWLFYCASLGLKRYIHFETCPFMEGMSAVTHRVTKQHIRLEIFPNAHNKSVHNTDKQVIQKNTWEGLSNRICEYHKAETCLTFFF